MIDQRDYHELEFQVYRCQNCECPACDGEEACYNVANVSTHGFLRSKGFINLAFTSLTAWLDMHSLPCCLEVSPETTTTTMSGKDNMTKLQLVGYYGRWGFVLTETLEPTAETYMHRIPKPKTPCEECHCHTDGLEEE